MARPLGDLAPRLQCGRLYRVPVLAAESPGGLVPGKPLTGEQGQARALSFGKRNVQVIGWPRCPVRNRRKILTFSDTRPDLRQLKLDRCYPEVSGLWVVKLGWR